MSVLIVPVGAPGSTKTTWCTDNGLLPYRLNLDVLREMMTGNMSDPTADRTAVWVFHVMMRERLERHLLTVADNTNYDPEYRKPLIGMATENGMPTIAVVFDVTPDKCMEYQATRDRVVPLERVKEMHATIWKPAKREKNPMVRRQMLAESLLGEGCATVIFHSPTGLPQLFGQPVPREPACLRDIAFSALYQETLL